MILFKNNRDQLLWELSLQIGNFSEIYSSYIVAMFIQLHLFETRRRCIQERWKQCGKSENFGNDFLPREGQMIHNHGDSNFTNRTLQTLQLGLATLLKHFNHKSFFAYLLSIAISLNRRNDTTCSMATKHSHRYGIHFLEINPLFFFYSYTLRYFRELLIIRVINKNSKRKKMKWRETKILIYAWPIILFNNRYKYFFNVRNVNWAISKWEFF